VLSVAAASGWEGRLRLARSERSEDELFVRLSLVHSGSPDVGSGLLVAECVPERRVSAAPVAPRAAERDEGDLPVLPVARRVIVVPVVGELTARRSQLLLRRLLAGVTEHRAKAVIVDVTGLVNVDERAADYLAKAVLAARLKGAKTIVSGVAQETAEALTEINAEWTGITTVGQLEMGLAMALGHVSRTQERQRSPEARGGR
jgi:anti-anti-sigma regulatory factor